MSVRAPLAALALICTGMPAAALADPVFFGPTPYLSPLDTPAGFDTGTLVIEDFEDGVMDRRLRTVGPSQIVGPASNADSVDVDDGVIDGSGTQGRSLFGANLRVEWAPPFPRAVGMVWTDGIMGGLTFEAFGPDGASLGTIEVPSIGDLSGLGTTAEDRFFGVRDEAGIASIGFVSGTDNAFMEIDHIQYSSTSEPAIVSTLEDGALGLLLPTPDGLLPTPTQETFGLPADVHPHGLAFLGGGEALFANFDQPELVRTSLDNPDAFTRIALPGRSNGNGSLAVDPNGRYALSIGQSNDAQPTGEAVVVDFGVVPPQVSTITGSLRVLSFVTAAIDFAPDGRAFVCHTGGVSVLERPYTSVAFTMPFPATVQSPSMCKLTRDGGRLFVSRMLSESAPSVNAIRTTRAPYSSSSSFTEIPAPLDVQGLGPIAVAPDGQSLLVGQQFLFPPQFTGTRARVFLVRAPFDSGRTWIELSLPTSVTGSVCTDGGGAIDCPGFEHIEVNADGSLAILTGNSSSEVAGTADAVPAVFIRRPFDFPQQTAMAVQLAPDATTPGRGAGGVRFRPIHIFTDGLED